MGGEAERSPTEVDYDRLGDAVLDAHAVVAPEVLEEADAFGGGDSVA